MGAAFMIGALRRKMFSALTIAGDSAKISKVAIANFLVGILLAMMILVFLLIITYCIEKSNEMLTTAKPERRDFKAWVLTAHREIHNMESVVQD